MGCILFPLFFQLILIFAMPFSLHSQVINTFNFNITNGLPSNHIYYVTRDTHGYLWIATSKGVVRYNGYEFKLFDLSDGLPSADVWQLYEDRKGRMWLASISDNIGYIQNNRYHMAYLKKADNGIYPGNIRENGSGIFFTNSNMGKLGICVERSDTVTNYPISDSLYTTMYRGNAPRFASALQWFSNNSDSSLLMCDSFIYKVAVRQNKISVSPLTNIGRSYFLQASKNQNFVINDHFLSYQPGTSTQFFTLTLPAGIADKTDISQYCHDGHIHYIYPDVTDSSLYLMTDNNILQFSYKDSIISKKTLAIAGLITDHKISGNKIRPVHNDSFWGLCIGTTTNGLWCAYNIPNNLVRHPDINLDNYDYLGNVDDSIFFWWNSAKGTFALLSQTNKITYRTYNIHNPLKGVARFRNDTLILFGTRNYFFNFKTGRIADLKLRNATSVVPLNEQNIIAATSIGLLKAEYISDSGFRVKVLANNRYAGIAFDRRRNNYLAYNSDNVFIYNPASGESRLFSKKDLSLFGMQRIEKIVCDNYGNIFFQDNDKITLYDYDHNRYTELFKNFNLKEASVFTNKDMLIVTGRFGVLFSSIYGLQQISRPFLRPNSKSINYTAVYDCEVLRRSVLINTDQGVYTTDIPGEMEIIQHKNDTVAYKFIVSYKDSAINIKTNDTLFVDQSDPRLQFDILNPFGTGKVRYKYFISDDTTWHDLNANELTLSSLPAGKYHTLSIIVSDNSWRSDQIDIHLYVRPYWWQTAAGRRTIVFAVVVLIILLFGLAVIVTRKIVLRANKRRNMQMELELKAIYAQINPHFIFNTLNSALLLVRKKRLEEAYEHISQFSRLLRSYIKSSRNKFITIADEIANLQDYLELQTTRFGDKFEYRVTVDDEINTRVVKIPTLLLQPFVENAINHGLLQKKEHGHLFIKFQVGNEKNEIICIVEDDGIGRKAAKSREEENSKGRISYGDLLISDLVDIFNKYEEMNIAISYFDKAEPESGTIVNIRIKNPHYG
jgi:two-component sensor histidine kinase